MDINSILDKIIKVLLVSVICITLIIVSLFVVPVYAEQLNDVDFSNQPLPFTSSDYSDVNSNGISFSSQYRFSCGTEGVAVYLFAVPYNDTQYYFYLASTSSGVNCYRANNYNTVQNIPLSVSSYFNTYGYYINTSTPVNGPVSVPIFDSLESAFTAIDNIGSVSLSFDSTITIEPGYVAYCLCEGGSVVLNAIMPMNSNLNIAGKPKWESMSRIAFGVQRPSTGTVLTNSFGSLINWQKNGTAPSNILGMTKYAQAIYNDLPSDGSFVAIYNPAYYGDDMSNPTQAPAISANFTNLGAVAKYPINTQVSYTPALGWNIQSGSDSDWSEYGIAVPSTDGAIITTDYIMSTTSEPAIVFPDGGYNDSNSVNNDPGSVLQRIIQPIINLLKAPFEHINNLISSGSAFMREIGQFFNWLPEPVLTLIVDALIVCVVIGVLKLLF